jgi:hypothetical protein
VTRAARVAGGHGHGQGMHLSCVVCVSWASVCVCVRMAACACVCMLAQPQAKGQPAKRAVGPPWDCETGAVGPWALDELCAVGCAHAGNSCCAAASAAGAAARGLPFSTRPI